MEMHRKYMATVSCQPNKQACYVRLSVPRPGHDLPLSVKACFAGFNRNNLHEGRIVQIMRTTPDDHTKYVLCNVLDNCGAPTSHDEESYDTALDQRVKFFLPHRYFQSGTKSNNGGMCKDTCVKVLKSAFGPPRDSEYTCWTAVTVHNRNGFNIVCTAEQFARFIILRHETNECINGIRDLKPELHLGSPWIPTLYDTMQEKFGVCRDTLEKLMKFADVPNRKMASRDYIDVTGRPDDQGACQ